jgi:hypothetical protein
MKGGNIGEHLYSFIGDASIIRKIEVSNMGKRLDSIVSDMLVISQI